MAAVDPVFRPEFREALTWLGRAVENMRRQGLTPPILVGGAAVEFYTGRAVTTGDFDFVDGRIRVNSALGRVKVRNMKPGAKVALSISDPDNPDRYVQLRGTVTNVRQDDLAAAHIDQLAYKYLGLDSNPYAKAGDVRVMFEISVFSVQGMS